jgi:exosortase
MNSAPPFEIQNERAAVGTFSIWIVFAFVGLIWWPALSRFSIEWSVNPQYFYGWSVPFLTAYLLVERYASRPAVNPSAWRWPALVLMLLLALPQFPLRIIAEPNTDWRMISWLMAGMAMGLTFCVFYLYGGWKWLFHFAFPVLFLATANPWPNAIESQLVQGMMRVNAQFAAEFVSLCGIPAIAMGNVIQLPNGVLGVDEACSGIRSLQSTLMASLFLGELYRLKVLARLLLVAVGVGIAFFLNLVRTSFLTWQGAFNGIKATDDWHDAAGFTILGGVLVCLFIISMILERGERKAAARKKAEIA